MLSNRHNKPAEGFFVSGWLVKTLLVLAVFGVPAIDGASILVTNFQVNNAVGDVNVAATGAAHGLLLPPSPAEVQSVYTAMQAAAKDHGDSILADNSFSIRNDGSVSYTLVRVAPTLVAGRLAETKKFTRIHLPETAGLSNNY